MLFDFATLSPNIRYKLLVSTVVPRPIAWVVSQDVHGVLNAAPYSFFNAFSSEPPVIGIGVGRRSSGHAKDTRANIVETSYDRAYYGVNLGDTAIDITMETRGPDHIAELLSALSASGYAHERIL